MKPTCTYLAAVGAVLLAAGVASAQSKTVYWDTNYTAAGCGNNGSSWEGVNWTTDPAGLTVPAPWVDGDSVIFSAGTDGTGTWHISIGSTITTPSIVWQDPFTSANDAWRSINGGTINIGGGTISTSALGFTQGNSYDVNINSVLAGSGGLTIAAHGDATSPGGGGGGAELRLGGTNTFSGGLTITSGLVSFNTDANLGDIANAITLNGGGILCTGNPHVTVRDIKVGAAGGTIRTYGGTTLTLNGTISNAAGVASATLRRTDGGTLIINTQGTGFTGSFIVGGGDVRLAAPNADWSKTDFTTVGGGSGRLVPDGGGTAVVNSLNTAADVVINNGTTLDVDTGAITMVQTNGHWYKTTLGALGKLTSSSGTLTINNGLTTGDLTTTDHRIRVQIIDSGTTPVALVKNYKNNLFLDQPNTYSGGTTINGGRVESYGTPSFGSGAVVVANGAQAWLRANGTYPNNFTINGIGATEGAANLGAIRFSGLATIAGTVNVATASRLTAYDSQDRGTITGPLTGSAALEKTGAGTIVISGDATGYTGALTVGAGTLGLRNNFGGSVVVADNAGIAGEGLISGDLTLGATAGAVLTVDGSTAAALGAANLTVNGLTSVKLAGTPTGAAMDVVTYSGTLTLSGATLDENFAVVDATSYRGAPAFADTGTAITLTIPAGSDLVWRGDDATNPTFWDTVVTTNWTSTVTDPDVFYVGDNVVFDDTGVSKTVSLQGMLSPATVTFNNSVGNNYTFIGLEPGNPGYAPNLGFTGATSIVKNGTGTVALAGYSHNYTGTVTINDGVLKPNGNYELLGNASAVTINDSVDGGGQLEIDGNNLGSWVRHYSLTIAGDGPNGLGAITNNGGGGPNEGAGLLNLTLSADASVGGNGGRFDIGRSGDSWGFLAGNGFTLTKVGSGTVCLRAPVTTDVTFVVEGGTLKFEDYNTVTGPNPITVNSGTVQSWGERTFTNTLNMGAGTTLDNDGGMQTWTGPINLTGVAGDTVFLSARNGRLMLPTVISGDSNIGVNGNDILFLTGSESNTYTGTTTLTGNDPELVLAKTGGAIAIPGDLYMSATGTRGIVSTIVDNQFGPASVMRWTGSADTRLELKGTTQTLAGIDNSTATPGYNCIQHSEFGNPPAVDGVSDLVLDVADGASFVYGGVLRDQGGIVNVTKTGLGTQRLQGGLIDQNGPTTVLAGRLIVNSDDTWTRRVDVSAGAVYEVNVTSTTEPFENRNAFTLAGAGTYEKTGPGNMSVGWENGATVAMASGGLIHIIQGSLRLEYAVRTTWDNNKADLTIDAGASFDLWDLSTSDGTYPNNGVFVDSLNGAGDVIRTTYAGTSPITIGVDNGDGDFSGSISNAVGMTHLVKAGTGTQTLRGALTHSGDTTVAGGTLVLADTSSIRFALADGGSSNRIKGIGTLVLDGTFAIDATALTAAAGNWTLVDAATLASCTYGATFSPGAGWTESADVWTMTDGDNNWTFTEATGVLSLQTSGGYASWAATNAAGQTAELDFDNDGVANGVEYFMGETGSTFTANPGVVGGKVAWPKSAEFLGDYAVETSPDLAVWTAVTEGVVDNGTSVEYTLPTGEVRIFVRLAVTPE